MITDFIERCNERYLGIVNGADGRLSFTALGGPAVGLGVLYLLWSWRQVGGIARPVAAATIPLAWFATLGVLTPDASAGPLVAFSRGTWHGLFWLAVAAVVGAVGNSQQPASSKVVPAGRQRGWLAAACLATAMAGVCLVGTALLGPATGRTIRVHNRGGLDWERPVFGRFGAFSGGMFGLLPVYCRAEGYNFGIIDKEVIVPADLDDTQILVLINSPRIWDEQEGAGQFSTSCPEAAACWCWAIIPTSSG